MAGFSSCDVRKPEEDDMNFGSFEEVIDFAIAQEIKAAEFYDEASRQESISGVRDMFQELAVEERKHRGLLEKFKRDQKQFDQYEYKWIPDLKRSDYLVEMTYEKGMFYVDILRLAMKREEASLKLYNEFLEKVESDTLVKLFKTLAQEEARHKLKLETEYDDFMAKQGD